MYVWRTDPPLETDTGQGDGFDDQADAEAWLSNAYEDLAAEGVESVGLYCDGALVYGPMSLDE